MLSTAGLSKDVVGCDLCLEGVLATCVNMRKTLRARPVRRPVQHRDSERPAKEQGRGGCGGGGRHEAEWEVELTRFGD